MIEIFTDGDHIEIDDVLDNSFFSSQPDDMPDLEDDDEVFADDEMSSRRIYEL